MEGGPCDEPDIQGARYNRYRTASVSNRRTGPDSVAVWCLPPWRQRVLGTRICEVALPARTQFQLRRRVGLWYKARRIGDLVRRCLARVRPPQNIQLRTNEGRGGRLIIAGSSATHFCQ